MDTQSKLFFLALLILFVISLIKYIAWRIATQIKLTNMLYNKLFSWKREQIKQHKAYVKDHIIFTLICVIVGFGLILVQIKLLNN